MPSPLQVLMACLPGGATQTFIFKGAQALGITAFLDWGCCPFTVIMGKTNPQRHQVDHLVVHIPPRLPPCVVAAFTPPAAQGH